MLGSALGLAACGPTVVTPAVALRADATLTVSLDFARLRASPVGMDARRTFADAAAEWPSLAACGDLATDLARIELADAPTGSSLALEGRGAAVTAVCATALADALGASLVGADFPFAGARRIERGTGRVVLHTGTVGAPGRLAAAYVGIGQLTLRQDLAARPLPEPLGGAIGLSPTELAYLASGAEGRVEVAVSAAGALQLTLTHATADDEREAMIARRVADELPPLAAGLALGLASMSREATASGAADALEEALAAPSVAHAGPAFHVRIETPPDAAPAVLGLASVLGRDVVARARTARAAREVTAIATGIEGLLGSLEAGTNPPPGLPQAPAHVPTGTSTRLVDADFGRTWERVGYRPSGVHFFAYRALVSRDEYRVFAEADLDGDGTTSLLVLDGRRTPGGFVRDAIFFDHFLE